MKKIILFFLLILIPSLGHAATFTVTKTADTKDGACDADCSLREAIIAANAAAGTDTIVFSATTATTYQIQIPGVGEESAATGDLDITDSVNIQGQVVNNTILTTIDGGGLDRVFQVSSGITVQISGVNIQNGNVLADPTFPYGGGIANLGDLTLTNVVLSGNTAEQGGAVVNYGTSLKVVTSTLNNNTAKKTANAGSGVGGGIEQNKIGKNAGTLTITNSTLSTNTAESSGGGIKYDAGTVNLNNVTFFGNIAPSGSGGGISADTSTNVNMRNSIVAGSKDSTGNADKDCIGTVTSQGFNWMQNQTGCTISGASSGDPKLDSTLSANNGPTPTHALLTGSGAIDAGDSTGCKDDTGAALTTDQRGLVRSLNGKGDGAAARCDIGAFELNLCGNGAIDGAVGEECDDGNLTGGDGCSSTCKKEDLDKDGHFSAKAGGDDCDDNDATSFSGATEVCDGKDNNCDGKTDENLGATTCGVGVCQVTVDNCVAGKTQTCTPKPASAEVCDGLDNDCDGKVDENLGATTCGVGVCQVTVDNCVAGKTQTCTPKPASAEVCDGIDNDCDGTVDNGFDLGASCTVGVGACAGTGKKICSTDGKSTVCNTSASNPGVEVCDGIDNDCDGNIDNGLGQTTCGQGACQVTIDNCKNGKTQTCASDDSKKTAEVCDGIDNDCNGSIDDGLGQTTCGQGLCQVTVDNCKNGQTKTCTPDLSKKLEEKEDKCGNGIDEDCDGSDLACTSTGTTETPAASSSSGGCSLIP